MERENATVKLKLAKLWTGLTWVKALPFVLTEMRGSPRAITNLSPHEILTGRPINLELAPPAGQLALTEYANVQGPEGDPQECGGCPYQTT